MKKLNIFLILAQILFIIVGFLNIFYNNELYKNNPIVISDLINIILLNLAFICLLVFFYQYIEFYVFDHKMALLILVFINYILRLIQLIIYLHTHYYLKPN